MMARYIGTKAVHFDAKEHFQSSSRSSTWRKCTHEAKDGKPAEHQRSCGNEAGGHSFWMLVEQPSHGGVQLRFKWRQSNANAKKWRDALERTTMLEKGMLELTVAARAGETSYRVLRSAELKWIDVDHNPANALSQGLCESGKLGEA